MRSYTITITPDDDTTTTTTLRLDTSGTEVRLTDLHLHAGNGLTAGQVPAVDFGLLLRAISPSEATPTPITAAAVRQEARVVSEPRHEPQPVVQVSDESQNDATPTAARPVVPAPRTLESRQTGRRAASKTAPAAAEPIRHTRARRTTKRANEAAAAPSKATRAAKKDSKPTRAKSTARATSAKKRAAAPSASGRAYRRMPEDFAAVYQRAGSAAAIADHYQVPRHTANGWIRRLRDKTTNRAGR